EGGIAYATRSCMDIPGAQPVCPIRSPRRALGFPHRRWGGALLSAPASAGGTSAQFVRVHTTLLLLNVNGISRGGEVDGKPSDRNNPKIQCGMIPVFANLQGVIFR